MGIQLVNAIAVSWQVWAIDQQATQWFVCTRRCHFHIGSCDCATELSLERLDCRFLAWIYSARPCVIPWKFLIDFWKCGFFFWLWSIIWEKWHFHFFRRHLGILAAILNFCSKRVTFWHFLSIVWHFEDPNPYIRAYFVHICPWCRLWKYFKIFEKIQDGRWIQYGFQFGRFAMLVHGLVSHFWLRWKLLIDFWKSAFVIGYGP